MFSKQLSVTEHTGLLVTKKLITEKGPIAQLGARLNGIEKVEGSNPSGSTKSNSKVTAGVVGHPVSELGKQGGSPATVSTGH